MNKKTVLTSLIAAGAALVIIPGLVVYAHESPKTSPGGLPREALFVAHESAPIAPVSPDVQPAPAPSVSSDFDANLAAQLRQMEDANLLSGKALLAYQEYVAHQDDYTVEALQALRAEADDYLRQSQATGPAEDFTYYGEPLTVAKQVFGSGEGAIVSEIKAPVTPEQTMAAIGLMHQAQSDAIIALRTYIERHDKYTNEAAATAALDWKEKAGTAQLTEEAIGGSTSAILKAAP